MRKTGSIRHRMGQPVKTSKKKMGLVELGGGGIVAVVDVIDEQYGTSKSGKVELV